MGGWLTLGTTRVLREDQSTDKLKQNIINGVVKLLKD